MGWIGNILLLYSWYGIGRKWRHAIMVGAIGSGFWAVKAFDASMWDLLFIEVTLGSFQVLAWWRWRNGSNSKRTTVV